MQVEIARHLGFRKPTTVCQAIRQFCDAHSTADVYTHCLYNEARRQVIRDILVSYTGGFQRPQDYTHQQHDDLTKPYWRARKEHAWLLRAEGLTYRAIGARLGVGPERIRHLVWSFGRYMAHAMRRTRVTIQ